MKGQPMKPEFQRNALALFPLIVTAVAGLAGPWTPPESEGAGGHDDAVAAQQALAGCREQARLLAQAQPDPAEASAPRPDRLQQQQGRIERCLQARLSGGADPALRVATQDGR
jgi:hypothetical protein